MGIQRQFSFNVADEIFICSIQCRLLSHSIDIKPILRRFLLVILLQIQNTASSLRRLGPLFTEVLCLLIETI